MEIFAANVLNVDGKTGRAHIGGQIMRTFVLIVERGWNLKKLRRTNNGSVYHTDCVFYSVLFSGRCGWKTVCKDRHGKGKMMGEERELFAEKLNDLFRVKEKKKYEVADTIGVQRTTISKYVNAHHIPSVEIFMWIANAIGATDEEILNCLHSFKSYEV